MAEIRTGAQAAGDFSREANVRRAIVQAYRDDPQHAVDARVAATARRARQIVEMQLGEMIEVPRADVMRRRRSGFRVIRAPADPDGTYVLHRVQRCCVARQDVAQRQAEGWEVLRAVRTPGGERIQVPASLVLAHEQAGCRVCD